MGDVIRKNAGVQDIFADAQQTLANAAARGGTWKQLAEERLARPLQMVGHVESRLAEAERALAPLESALDAVDYKADRLLGKLADDLWNAAGRPAGDPNLAVLFPGGIGYYTDGADDEQPERMELLAELLETIRVPFLDAAAATQAAGEVRRVITEYRAALDAVRMPRARARLLERVRTALARTTQMELSHVKRLYKAAGFTEPEIHTVIPSRPRGTRAASADPRPAA